MAMITPLNVDQVIKDNQLELLNERIFKDKTRTSEVCQVNQMKPLSSGTLEDLLIRHYFSSSNTFECRDLSIAKIWSINRERDESLFRERGNDQKNSMLLWLCQTQRKVDSILNHGLKSAKTANRRFGTGFYFADRVSKAIKCCQTNDLTNESHYYLFLCKVVPGNIYEMTPANKIANWLPCYRQEQPMTKLYRYDSIKGLGTWRPNPDHYAYLHEMVVPFGKTERNPLVIESSIRFNEYCVYNETDILIKYLVVVKDRHKYD